jgi:hypothetical protein
VRVRNAAGEDLLAVVAIDGVNVLSGQTATVSQGGYVVGSYGALDVAGWRKSLDRIAAFYFTTLPDSYAARTGRPTSGVIGVALFKRKALPSKRSGRRPREGRGTGIRARRRSRAARWRIPRQGRARETPLALCRSERDVVRWTQFERASEPPRWSRSATTATPISSRWESSRAALAALSDAFPASCRPGVGPSALRAGRALSRVATGRGVVTAACPRPTNNSCSPSPRGCRGFRPPYARHRGTVFRFVRARPVAGRCRGVQEVWMKAIEARHRYEPRAKFTMALRHRATTSSTPGGRRGSLVPLDGGGEDDPLSTRPPTPATSHSRRSPRARRWPGSSPPSRRCRPRSARPS